METSKNVVSTDDVIGVKVKNHAGEKLGEIKKLVLDKITGQVCYVTLSVGGFLGMGEKYVAVPWKALNYDKNQNSFVLNVDKSKLENAEGLANNWSDWGNKKWGEDLHHYYGLPPYWNKASDSEIHQLGEKNIEQFDIKDKEE